MIKAIIFDLWETLIFSEQNCFDSISELLGVGKVEFSRKVNKSPIQTVPHSNEKKVWEDFLISIGINPDPDVVSKIRRLWDDNILKTRYYPEVVEVLDSLKDKYVLVLLSTTDSHSYGILSKKLGLCDYFKFCITSHEEGISKPSEKFFRSAISRMDFEPEEIAMVGNSLYYDMEPAEKLGLFTVLVDRKGKKTYKRRISSLRELEKLFESEV